jgi:hypothetical protein
MALEREVMPDRTKARQESWRAFRDPEASHTALAFTRRLMAVFGPVVHASTDPDEDVFDFGQFRDLSLCRRVATQLVGHNLARHFGTKGEHTLENRLAATLLRRFFNRISSSAPCWSTARHNR